MDKLFKVWKKYGFEDMNFEKKFQEGFEGFIKKNFKLASNYNI